ncbi:hypothetical protein L228DRAFT_151788 [Xylona heveae TC161]|uniref:Uncharacterized protein n=1 Tax=Xylona heveae (strain CBS 132557 / TC161) TaxID=1328760 RepID=A0A165GND2_XYLHT|nr:hypothetical protein L228DRAFT_151788 [Xylona heveae TC161]KZF22400.1 hypothetical protein L228DRAFT_151788 [Xylona heveae TC161]
MAAMQHGCLYSLLFPPLPLGSKFLFLFLRRPSFLLLFFCLVIFLLHFLVPPPRAPHISHLASLPLQHPAPSLFSAGLSPASTSLPPYPPLNFLLSLGPKTSNPGPRKNQNNLTKEKENKKNKKEK